MILKLINNENTYEFNVTDLNEGVKLYYHFEIPTVDIPDGKYNMQLLDGETVIYEDIVCIGDFKGATIQYKRGDNIYINAPIDGKFEDVTVEITATQTTVYPNDGFDAMTSVVIDATPVYDDGYNTGNADGYNTGKQDGETVGYNNGYSIGYADGVENAIENTIVLNTTEFGTYYTKYSDNIVYPEVTGEFEDGTPFYNCAELHNISYSTGIISDNDTKIELWWCGNVDDDNNRPIIGGYASNGNFIVAVDANNSLQAEINFREVNKQNLENDVWYHIELSKQEGFKINGELIGTFESAGDVKNLNIYINKGTLIANGKFGMIKITQNEITNVIIPTPDGFLNTNTNEILSVSSTDGLPKYKYINNDPIILDNLIKQVNVNTKINVVENGLKFAYSTFTEVPDFYDFSNITDLKNMFRDCSKLQTIPEIIDFSNVTNMESCFEGCKSLQTIAEINISNATNLNNLFRSCQSINTMPELPTHKAIYMSRIFEDCITLKIAPVMTTNNVTDVGYMFWGCVYLQQIPAYDFSNVKSMGNMFRFNFQGDMNYLTDVGGWIGLKVNWNDNYGLARCPNLTYQSCINILNGLADITELGSRTLKVHSNFLTTVGDEISIGTSKGWTITA